MVSQAKKNQAVFHLFCVIAVTALFGCNASLSLDGQSSKPQKSDVVSSQAPNASSSTTPPLKETVSVSEVQVIPERLVIESNKSSKAVGTVRYADNTTDSNLIWSASDNTIASVDPVSGDIKALKGGEVTIIATAARDNTKRAAIQVSVRNTVTEAALVNIEPKTLTLKKGASGTLKATVKLADGSESSNLTWNISDRTIAVLKSNGSSVNVTAIAIGTATITASSDDDPTKSVQATVIVE